MTLLQIQANGEVRACLARGPLGNIRERSVREIWDSRIGGWVIVVCPSVPPCRGKARPGPVLFFHEWEGQALPLLGGTFAGAQVDAHVVVSRIHDVNRDAAVAQSLDRCRRGETGEIPTGRQHDGIP